jgi:hypothetical protein
MPEMVQTIILPKLCCVALIGSSWSGNTMCAHKHFPTDSRLSDVWRAMMRGNE